MVNKVLFDFDGTLIRGNSFPLWIRHLLFCSLIEARVCVFIKIIYLLVKRKILHLSSHEDLKHSLILLDVPDAWTKSFISLIVKRARKDTIDMAVGHILNGDKVIISSAAPIKYLSPIVHKLFGMEAQEISIIGADVVNGKLNNNHKKMKLVNLYTMKLLDESDFLQYLYTDSCDDRYLAAVTERLLLVSPDSKTLIYFNSNESSNRFFCLMQ